MLIGPVIAVLSFVCSVGNVPLAAVLWSGGISFAGVLAFLFADLIVLPIVAIYRKYYGTAFALRISALMLLTMIVAALIVSGVFSLAGAIPSGPRPTRGDIFGSIAVNYKLVLNVVGAVIFAALFWLTMRRGVIDPVCGMTVDRATAVTRRTPDGTRYFCSRTAPARTTPIGRAPSTGGRTHTRTPDRPPRTADRPRGGHEASARAVDFARPRSSGKMRPQIERRNRTEGGSMPQYMLLIYNPADGGPTPEEMAAQHEHWMSYTDALRDAGLYVAGDALQGVDVATTVRVRDGEPSMTDGPFAETKELLGGLLPDRRAGSRHGARVGGADAERRVRLRRGASDLGHDPAAGDRRPGRRAGIAGGVGNRAPGDCPPRVGRQANLPTPSWPPGQLARQSRASAIAHPPAVGLYAPIRGIPPCVARACGA